MATTDYLTVLVAQSMALSNDIQPLIVPRFAPEQLPTFESLRFIEEDENMFAPPTPPVQPAEQNEHSSVTRFEAAPESPADSLHVSTLHNAFMRPQQKPEETGDSIFSGNQSVAPVSSPSDVVAQPVARKEQERSPDQPLPRAASMEKDQLPQNITVGSAVTSADNAAITPRSASPITKAERRKHEAALQREQAGEREQDVASPLQRLSREEQPSPAISPLLALSEENKSQIHTLSSANFPAIPTSSTQIEPPGQHPRMTPLPIQRADITATDMTKPFPPRETFAQPVSIFPARLPASEPLAIRDAVRQGPTFSSSVPSGEGTYEPLIHDPCAVSIEVRRLLALSTPLSSPPQVIRPAQMPPVKQVERGMTEGYEQPANDGLIAQHRAPEQMAREERVVHKKLHEELAEQVPLVRVTIGRIDVRALAPRPAAPKRAPAGHTTLSLKEYLEQRRKR